MWNVQSQLLLINQRIDLLDGTDEPYEGCFFPECFLSRKSEDIPAKTVEFISREGAKDGKGSKEKDKASGNGNNDGSRRKRTAGTEKGIVLQISKQMSIIHS